MTGLGCYDNQNEAVFNKNFKGFYIQNEKNNLL